MNDKTISKVSKLYGESVVRLEVPASVAPLVRLLRLLSMYRYQLEKGPNPGFPAVYQALLEEVQKEISIFAKGQKK